MEMSTTYLRRLTGVINNIQPESWIMLISTLRFLTGSLEPSIQITLISSFEIVDII